MQTVFYFFLYFVKYVVSKEIRITDLLILHGPTCGKKFILGLPVSLHFSVFS
jgi:hypothetical protein